MRSPLPLDLPVESCSGGRPAVDDQPRLPFGEDEDGAAGNECGVCAGRLRRIEALLERLVGREATQEYYSTADAAFLLGRSDYTVREWCRLGRVHAEKRACGRGPSRDWKIAHAEIERVRAEGLLPRAREDRGLRERRESGRIPR